jgi:hypothetical protein
MDTITGMRTSPDGSHLLTNSMDNTLRCVRVWWGRVAHAKSAARGSAAERPDGSARAVGV